MQTPHTPLRLRTRWCIAALAALASSSCSGDSQANGSPDEPDRPLVVVTTTMIGDLAREIAGKDAKVEVLFGTHIDPHLFRPTRDDVALLMRADLVVWNGFGLEGYLAETLRRVEDAGADTLVLAEAIVAPNEQLRDGAAPDPHVWMDPSLWRRACGELANAIVAELPAPALLETGTASLDANTASLDANTGAHGAQVMARAAVVAARLAELDASCEARLSTIPKASRVLVTAHDAFGYFGRRYDIEVLGIQGVSTASEAGLLAIEQLVDRLSRDRVAAVFFESTVAPRNVSALVEGAAARGHKIAIGGVLHSDAPGDAGSYEAMIEHNVATIVAALGQPVAADSETAASHAEEPAPTAEVER